MELRTNYVPSDTEMILYVRENISDDAKDYIYKKYTPLIHKEINRFKKKAIALNVDLSDLSQEAMLAFSCAINTFNEEEEVKFMTYATLVIRRKLTNYLKKFDTVKNKTMVGAVSMDAPVDDENQSSYVETMESETSFDPLRTMITNETLKELNIKIREKLSKNEKIALQFDLEGKSILEISSLMGMSNKQIYNLIHRARNKLK